MKKKYTIFQNAGLHYRLIDKTQDSLRTVKLKAINNGGTWSPGWCGRQLAKITDDGNGLCFTAAGAAEIRLDYDVAGELFELLKHLNETGNYFERSTKVADDID